MPLLILPVLRKFYRQNKQCEMRNVTKEMIYAIFMDSLKNVFTVQYSWEIYVLFKCCFVLYLSMTPETPNLAIIFQKIEVKNTAPCLCRFVLLLPCDGGVGSRHCWDGTLSKSRK